MFSCVLVSDWTSGRGTGLRTVLRAVVAGGGRSLVLVEPQQGEEREKRLGVTHQDGGRLRRRVRGPERHRQSLMINKVHSNSHPDSFLPSVSLQNKSSKFEGGVCKRPAGGAAAAQRHHRPARASGFVERPEDVMEERTAGQAADHMTVGALPVLLQVRLVLQHLQRDGR